MTEDDDRVSAVIVAAGAGERAGGGTPKQFRDLGGRPMLAWSIEAFRNHPLIDELVVVLSSDRAGSPPDWLPAGVRVAVGGATRAESVRAGVAALSASRRSVLVHDGARPFVSDDLISRVARAALAGPVIPVVPLDDTVKRMGRGDIIAETVPREDLRRAQTPQGFPIDVLERAHAVDDGTVGATDDALLCERLGIPVRAIEGDVDNLKITSSRDLAFARWQVETGLMPDVN